MAESWTVDELREARVRYERELVAAGKADNMVTTYVDRARRFIAWLDGPYTPR